jgi:hypothetical protein
MIFINHSSSLPEDKDRFLGLSSNILIDMGYATEQFKIVYDQELNTQLY